MNIEGCGSDQLRDIPGSPATAIPGDWIIYRCERDMMLRQIADALLADERVSAAWLFGSLGRGDEDTLSDLDVWVVVDDAYIPDVLANSRRAAASAGDPLWFVEAPQNAPLNGAYLMGVYDAPTAPHLVDWYWQPRSQAARPRQTRLLFDRAGLPELAGTTPGGQGVPDQLTVTEAADLAIRFFWAMLMITAKHAARKPWEKEMSLLPYVLGPLTQVRRFAGEAELQCTVRPHTLPADKLAVFRELASEMVRVSECAGARSLGPPPGAADGAQRYLDLVEPVLRAGDQSGAPGSTSANRDEGPSRRPHE